jgi:hypothetical protein
MQHMYMRRGLSLDLCEISFFRLAVSLQSLLVGDSLDVQVGRPPDADFGMDLARKATKAQVHSRDSRKRKLPAGTQQQHQPRVKLRGARSAPK